MGGHWGAFKTEGALSANIMVEPAHGKKCTRCWLYKESVSTLLITLNSVSTAMMWSACVKQMEKINHNIVDIHYHDKDHHN